MNSIKKNRCSILIFLILFFWMFQRCARPGTPTGGPKDEDSPLLLFSYPKQKEIKFGDDRLVLVFNEWVKLKNIKKELVITPSIKGNYKSKHKKNEIQISNLKLDSNTTYTFAFRESIVDITESNPAEELNLIFSTGKYIDSLTISGYIINSKLKNKKLVVGLYQDIDSLNLFTKPPKYLINVDTVNNFRFRYIKPDTYKIYAFTDYNGNKICDSKKESYGFILNKLKVNKSIDSLKLILTKNNIDSLKVLGSKKSGKYYEVLFSKPIDTLEVQSEDSILYQIIDDRKKVRLYNVLDDTLERSFNLKLYDSIGNKKDTLMTYKFALKSKLEDTFEMKVKKNDILDDRLTKIYFSFTKPVRINETDSLGLYLDSTFLDIKTKKVWNYNNTRLEIEQKIEIDSLFEHYETDNTIEEGEEKEKIKMPKIQYYIPKGTFLSIDNDSSVFKSVVFNIVDPEKRAYISGEIECDADSLVFELMNGNKVVERILHKKKFNLKYLKAGKYTFRYFKDNNMNGKKDNGNFFKNILPEEYVILKKEYEMRESWGLEKQIIECDNRNYEEENDVENE